MPCPRVQLTRELQFQLAEFSGSASVSLHFVRQLPAGSTGCEPAHPHVLLAQTAVEALRLDGLRYIMGTT